MLLEAERAPRTLEPAGTHTLDQRLRGSVITPDHAEYDQARRVWNNAFDRQPALVVRAAGAQDVAQAIAYAREHDLPLAIRSGGHGLAGFGSVDRGLVLDLSQLKGVSTDPDMRTAWVQPGVTSEVLAPLAAEHGLWLSTGDAPTVGIGAQHGAPTAPGWTPSGRKCGRSARASTPTSWRRRKATASRRPIRVTPTRTWRR